MKRWMLCTVLLSAGVVVGLPNNAVSEMVPQGGALKTATNLEGIDLNDTTEDPGYAEAGEEIAKEASLGVIGVPAPLAKLKTIDGETIDLATIYGEKPVYIKFWATWCTPCRQQMPGFQHVYETLGDKLEVIAVNTGFSDDEASVRAFRDKFGLTMPVVIDDGTLSKLFHLNVTPQHVLIGRDATFAYIGHADNEQLENAIQQVISESNLVATATAASVEPEVVIRPGDLVPDISITLLSGENLPLKAQPDRILALAFFSSWCEWYLETSRPETSMACARVREEIENMTTTIPTLDWVGVSGGPWATEQDLVDYKKNNNVTIPLSLDTSDSLFRSFAIRDIPTIALINDSGRLIRLIGPEQTNVTGIIQSAIAEETK